MFHLEHKSDSSTAIHILINVYDVSEKMSDS